jgi:hypothetical protein
MTDLSLRRPAGVIILAALSLGIGVCASTASAVSDPPTGLPQASVAPPANPTPADPSSDPTLPDVSDGNEGLQEQGGSGAEWCRLLAHISQQSGTKITDSVGWIGSCLPDTGPLIYTLLRACVVETAGSWHEVSCTSIRGQTGFPPLYSYHAGWRCTVGVNYRARVYGVFSRVGAPLWSNPGISTSGPLLCT